MNNRSTLDEEWTESFEARLEARITLEVAKYLLADERRKRKECEERNKALELRAQHFENLWRFGATEKKEVAAPLVTEAGPSTARQRCVPCHRCQQTHTS